ncbi:YqjF family protein [Actinorugispora endophytica]|uniref:DUF2071 domain-containing protein n=1 Tax=Actinorugispora endophytica TaxID=1605990 RepID=A0A4R6UWW2_9ACTN|nr:DUF2071 domain-containing protein [Actinorugispora endophytica]TDQ50766.1 hypothetical protein EV190_11271 [Actinorugispora endophytica]
MTHQDRIPPLDPPPLPRSVLLAQGWRDVAFLHWPVAPADAAPLLPPSTRPDVLDGVTYVGVVAFAVTGTRVLGAVPTGGFTEFNVRLYSVDERGNQGVVFLSLDADSAHNALAARVLTGLPYMWSDASVGRDRDGRVGYASRRRLPGPGARSRFRVRPGGRLEHPSPLDVFLTARWGLHTRHLGRTHWVRVAHRAWPLHRAELLSCEQDLTAAAGLCVAGAPVSVLWSPGVDTDVTISKPSEEAIHT